MSSAARGIAEITTELFARLEQDGFRYAVLRNYERLPHLLTTAEDHPVTDVDLVMHREDLPSWRNLAVTLAEDCGWDVLTECTHFCVSPIPEHRIEIFRFYRRSPPACLQVDIFHGFLLWAVPFETEQAMLGGRFEDPRFHLTRISGASENVFRMVQLHSLLPNGARVEKISRYRAKILEHYAAYDAQYRQDLRAAFSTFGGHALDALIQSDLVRFRRAMRFSKAWFWARFWLKHPALAPRYVYERAKDHGSRFITRQCGFVLAAHAPSERDRQRLRSALDELTGKKILPAFTMPGGERARITWREHQVMERGGIAVKWANEPGSSLDVSQAADQEELVASILGRLIARHRPLYTRDASGHTEIHRRLDSPEESRSQEMRKT